MKKQIFEFKMRAMQYGNDYYEEFDYCYKGSQWKEEMMNCILEYIRYNQYGDIIEFVEIYDNDVILTIASNKDGKVEVSFNEEYEF